jgi:hypothetical protein
VEQREYNSTNNSNNNLFLINNDNNRGRRFENNDRTGLIVINVGWGVGWMRHNEERVGCCCYSNSAMTIINDNE